MILNCAKRYFIQIILFYTLILLVNCDELEAHISLNVEGTGFHRLCISKYTHIYIYIVRISIIQINK